MTHIIYNSHTEAELMHAAEEHETLVIVRDRETITYYLRTKCKRRETALRRWSKAVEAVAGPDVVKAVSGWDLLADGTDHRIYQAEEEWVVDIMVRRLDPLPAPRWPRLREMVDAAYLRDLSDAVQRIETGGPEDKGKVYLRYLSVALRDRYRAGTLSEADAKKAARRGAWAECRKSQEKQYRKMEAAEQAPELERADAAITWRKNRSWGDTPTVTLTAPDGVYYSRAGGWGYDKRSAALSEALSQSRSAMRALYDTAEALLASGERPTENHYVGGYNWATLLPYGSGYGPLPCYEAAVGVDCTAQVLEVCGYKLRRRELSRAGGVELYSIMTNQDRRA